jgi:hypothetical protein
MLRPIASPKQRSIFATAPCRMCIMCHEHSTPIWILMDSMIPICLKPIIIYETYCRFISI